MDVGRKGQCRNGADRSGSSGVKFQACRFLAVTAGS